MIRAGQGGRPAQQRRTRKALLTAAARLLRDGTTPTVAEAAEAADVSRRTAYRYFPTQEQLLTEAALESLRGGIEASFASIEHDPARRLEAVVRAMQAETIANERLLRTMIRLTIERGDDARRPERGAPSLRGNRRLEWLRSAVEPARARLGDAATERLVAALCLCVGAEALIVLRDVAALDRERAVETSVRAARALLDAALREARRR